MVPPQEQRWGANDPEGDPEDDATSAEWCGHRRVIRGVTENEGGDAEKDIDHHCRNKGVTGDEAKRAMDSVKEVADGPKKEEDRGVQEHVCSVHEPPHLESAKAFE